MGRTEHPPWTRGETYYNGGTIDLSDPLGLGGINLEGKEYDFEPNSEDQGTGFPATQDPNGRPVKVKVVRNRSGVNLKGGRLAHFDSSGTYKYESGVDGYCYQLADRPAGVVDEYLPPAGVVPNDLFYIVIEGPTLVTNQHAAAITTAVESRLVPAATGASRTDDLAGRVALQDLTGATATLGDNILNYIGYAGSVNSTVDAKFEAVVDLDD